MLNGIRTSAFTCGNAADNAVALSLGAAGSSGAAISLVNRFDASADGAVALVSTQTDYAPMVSSAAASCGAPLNATGSVSGTSIGVTGNTVRI